MEHAALSSVISIQNSVAKAISHGLNPLILGPIMFMYLFQYQPDDLVSFSLFTCIVMIFFGLLPLCILLTFKYLKKIETIDVVNRTNRHKPFIFGITSYGIGAFIIGEWFSWNGILIAAIFTLLSSSAIAAIITLKWKVSVHNAAASISATFLIISCLYLSDGSSFPFTLLLALFLGFSMIWSRVTLKAHTLSQSISGSLLGVIISLFYSWLIPF